MPKNIVLCSDGTGQSGGQGFVSNVWRVFKAIERHDEKTEQIAFHTDGVGSEKKPCPACYWWWIWLWSK